MACRFPWFRRSALGDGLTPRAQLLPGYGNGSLPKGKRTLASGSTPRPSRFPPRGRGETPVAIFFRVRAQRLWTFSLFKDTHLTESKVLQLRAEVFNLANTPQFNNPAATVGSGAFGTISSAAGINLSTDRSPSVCGEDQLLACPGIHERQYSVTNSGAQITFFCTLRRDL
jgi:hypothetical protein